MKNKTKRKAIRTARFKMGFQNPIVRKVTRRGKSPSLYQHSISSLNNYVLGMQIQLAVALRSGNSPDPVNALSQKILRCKEARYSAVYRTVSAKGVRSKDVGDHPTLLLKDDMHTLAQKLWEIIKNPYSYISSPLQRTFFPKPNTDPPEHRPISVPSYTDRALQHLYHFVFQVFHEHVADKNSYGFRSFLSPGWAAKAVPLTFWSRKGFGIPKYCLSLEIREIFRRNQI